MRKRISISEGTMSLENIVKTVAFVGAITVASAFPLFSDDAVTVDKDEETSIEYFYNNQAGKIGYEDSSNSDTIYLNENGDGDRPVTSIDTTSLNGSISYNLEPFSFFTIIDQNLAFRGF